MKKILIFLVIVLLMAVSFAIYQNHVNAPAVPEVEDEVVINQPVEFCFAEFGETQVSGFSDKFTLRMNLDADDVAGYLKLLPAEKDASLGSFEGFVSKVDPYDMTKTTIDAIWAREGEGRTQNEQLRIIFGEGNASIGFGAMKENSDGSYSYEDINTINYSLALTDYPCADLTEREEVEEILWKNINTLSPVPPVLGGKFYVVSMDLNLVENSGQVVYEDGHIQEKREFSYEVIENKVVNLKIK